MIIHEASVVCPPILIRNWGEKILPKSFKEEVRPATDVNNFIADVNIVLDLNETDLRKILEISISKVSRLKCFSFLSKLIKRGKLFRESNFASNLKFVFYYFHN